MDEFLAQFYGTNQPQVNQQEEIEKMAQLTLLTKMAAQEGIDLNQLSNEQIAALHNEVFNQGQMQKQASNMEKEAQEKFAEADYLGRIMAHSFTQELNNIQKTAQDPQLPVLNPFAAGQAEAAGMLGGLPENLGADPAAQQAWYQRALGAVKGAPGKVHGGAKALGSWMTGARGPAALHAGLGYGVPALAAAGLGTGGYYGGKALGLWGNQEKQSQLNQAVAQRSYEILQANGLADQYGNIAPPYVEKTASQGDAITQLALQNLAKLGYTVG
jgi:hypothetical protein